MSTLSQFAAGGIKSIQRGTISVVSTATATITAVNTAKTMLNFCGCSDGYTATAPTFASSSIALTSSTQVTAKSPIFAYSSPYPAVVSYEVIEYF